MIRDRNSDERTVERAWVLGASGFIGSALSRLLAEEDLKVRCLVHNNPLQTDHPNIEPVRGDLTNFNWEALQEFYPDVIYHFARIPGRTAKERREAAIRNAKANRQLIQWMKDQIEPPLLVFGSGTLVYGNRGQKRTDESAPVNPVGFQREYFEAERPVLEALEQSYLPVIVIRPPWIYGPDSWFRWFYLKHMQEKESIPQYGNGKNHMSLIHIEDCAGLIHHIAKGGDLRTVYNIYTHPPLSQEEFAFELQQLTGLPVKKYSRLRMLVQFDKAAREALTFSLKSATRHEELLAQYEFKYPALSSGLESVLNQLDNEY